MKTRYLMLSALVAATVACGGGADPKPADPKQTVLIETSSAILVQDAVDGVVTIACTNAGVTYGPFTLLYSASSGTFKGDFEVPNVTATYSCDISVRNAGGVLIGQSLGNTLAVTANRLATLTVTLPSSLDPLPAFGFVLASSTGPTYIDNLGAGTFALTVRKATAAPDPVFSWTATTGTPAAPCDGSFSATNTASVVYTAGATQQICTIKATIRDGTNSSLKVDKTYTVGLGVNVSPAVTFVPAPTIWKIEIGSNGGYSGSFSFPPDVAVTTAKKLNPAEAACTLLRAASGTTQGSQTCPGSYKLNSAIQQLIDDPFYQWMALPPVATMVSPTFTIGINYDLAGVYDFAKPPQVSATANCLNLNAGSGFLDPFPPAVGDPPKVPVATLTLTGSTDGAIFKWVFPPSFSAGTNTLCEFVFTVTNLTVVDTYPAYVYIVQ